MYSNKPIASVQILIYLHNEREIFLMRISGDVNPPCWFVLKHQRDLDGSRGSRRGTSGVYEICRFAGEHRLDEHLCQRITGGENRITRPGQPVKQQFGGKVLGI